MRETQNQQIELEYISKLFNPQSQKDKVFFESMEKLGPRGMSINSVEAGILKFFIRSIAAKKIVEIGCFAGFSAWQMSQAISADATIISIEKNEEFYHAAVENLKQVEAKNIKVMLGEALEILKSIESPVDFVFIDADKGGYFDYLMWAEENLRPGGMVILDNCFLFGGVFSETKPENESHKRWSTMKKVNEYLSHSEKWNSIILPTAEGLAIGQKLDL